MKKIETLILLLLCCTTYLSAQISEDYEILFTDENGHQDVMELPESMMMSELDSMLALYHAKTYLINDEAPTTPSSGSSSTATAPVCAGR